MEGTLARTAEQVARGALADVGLEGKGAALDIHDLRALIDCIRFVRRSALQTPVRLFSAGSAGRDLRTQCGHKT